MKELIICLLIKIICICLLFTYVFGISNVKSNNMNPSFVSGSLIIFYKLNKNYKKNDVVVTNKGIFRIIATPYEIVDINNGIVSINYYEEDKYLFNTYKNEESTVEYPCALNKNEYFVLNDYRYDYNDSRVFGSISISDIKGVVLSKIQVRDF